MVSQLDWLDRHPQPVGRVKSMSESDAGLANLEHSIARLRAARAANIAA